MTEVGNVTDEAVKQAAIVKKQDKLILSKIQDSYDMSQCDPMLCAKGDDPEDDKYLI